MSINDDLHAALKKYDTLLARNVKAEAKTAAKSEQDILSDIDLVDPFGLKADPLPSKNTTTRDLIDGDDSFADFVHARAGSTAKRDGNDKISTSEDSVSEVESKPAVPMSQQQQEDDPFVSFVQQRATKILSSSDQNCESETKPAAAQLADPGKDLIDLWDGKTRCESHAARCKN